MRTFFSRLSQWWQGAVRVLYLPEGLARRNAENSLWDGVFVAAATGLTTPFLGPFVMSLGGTDVQVGWVTAAPALGALLSQLAAVVLTERAANRLPVVLSYGMAYRLFFLLFAALPFLEQLPQAWVFAVGLGLATAPATVMNTAWTTLMGELFPGRVRAQVFAHRYMWMALATLAGTALAGPLLDLFPYPWNWCSLFLLAFACLMVSFLYLTRLREEGPLPRVHRSAFAYGEVFRDRGFMAFLLPVGLFWAGFHLATPIYPIIYVRKLALANSWIGTFSLITGLFSVLTYRYWGRMSDRRGHAWVLVVSTAVHILFPLGYAVAGSAYPILWWSAVGGVFGAAFNLAVFSLLLDLSPAEARARYVAAYGLVVNATALAFPLLGVAAYEAWGLLAAMGLSTLGRAIGVASLAYGMRRSRVYIAPADARPGIPA